MTARTATPGSTDEIARNIDALRSQPDARARLLELLPEQSPIYAGRRTTEIEQLRARILASFEHVGLPGDAFPYVLEELETGSNPCTVAAAGRALLGTASPPTEAAELIVAALSRLRGNDDVFAFDLPTSAPPAGETALADLASTLIALGQRGRSVQTSLTALLERDGAGFSDSVRATLAKAFDELATPAPETSCCHAHQEQTSPEGRAHVPRSASVAEIELENQDGARFTFKDAFAGRPTALAFFYTRCTNPEKCSRTITGLANLAQLTVASKLDANVAAITYDPRFDHPRRLKRYGTARGMRFSAHCSLLRTTGPLDPLLDSFRLGVGFGPVTVNRHKLELFILDAELQLTRTFERRLWTEDLLLDALRDAGGARARI